MDSLNVDQRPNANGQVTEEEFSPFDPNFIVPPDDTTSSGQVTRYRIVRGDPEFLRLLQTRGLISGIAANVGQWTITVEERTVLPAGTNVNEINEAGVYVHNANDTPVNHVPVAYPRIPFGYIRGNGSMALNGLEGHTAGQINPANGIPSPTPINMANGDGGMSGLQGSDHTNATNTISEDNNEQPVDDGTEYPTPLPDIPISPSRSTRHRDVLRGRHVFDPVARGFGYCRPDEILTTCLIRDRVTRVCLKDEFRTRVIFTASAMYTRVDHVSMSGFADCAFVYKPRMSLFGGPGCVRFRLENKGPTGEAHDPSDDRAALRSIIAALGFREWSSEEMDLLIIGVDSSELIEEAIDYITLWSIDAFDPDDDVDDGDLWQVLLEEWQWYADKGVTIAFWDLSASENPAREALQSYGESVEDYIEFYAT